jgi:hypothetical protein
MKIRYINEDPGMGLFVSIQDFCAYLHHIGLLSFRESKKLRWDMMEEQTKRLLTGLKQGAVSNIDFMLIYGIDDFFCKWHYFGTIRDKVPEKCKNDESFRILLRKIDTLIDENPDESVFAQCPSNTPAPTPPSANQCRKI